MTGKNMETGVITPPTAVPHFLGILPILFPLFLLLVVVVRMKIRG